MYSAGGCLLQVDVFCRWMYSARRRDVGTVPAPYVRASTLGTPQRKEVVDKDLRQGKRRSRCDADVQMSISVLVHAPYMLLHDKPCCRMLGSENSLVSIDPCVGTD